MPNRLEQTIEFWVVGKNKEELLKASKQKLANLGFEHYDLTMDISEGRDLSARKTGNLHAKVTAYVHDYFD